MNKEENLGMGLFNSNNIELNLGLSPEDLGEYQEQEEQEEYIEVPTEEKENNLNEDKKDPEGVVEEEDQEKDDNSDSSDSDDSSPNIYSSFASVLSEKGLLPSLDLQESRIETIDDLTEAFRSEIEIQAKDYLVSKLGEEGYDAIEKGISLAQYQEHQESTQLLDKIQEEDLEQDLELSKRIIYQDYINQGIDEKRALRILKKTIDLGEDAIIEESKESLASLKEFQKIRIEQLKEENTRRIEAQQAYQEKIDNDLKSSIYNTKEIINGIKLNKNIQDRVYKSITEVVGKAPSGVMENKLMKDRRENPIEFDTKLYYLYEITNGFSDFSKLMSKTRSTAVGDLEKSLRHNKFESSDKPSYLTDPESYDTNIGDELVF